MVLQVTIVGIPAAIVLINRIRQIVTLKPSKDLQVTILEGVAVVGQAVREQRAWWARTIWYLLIGFWAARVWVVDAWVMCVLVVTMPVGFWMFGQTGRVQTLRR